VGCAKLPSVTVADVTDRLIRTTISELDICPLGERRDNGKMLTRWVGKLQFKPLSSSKCSPHGGNSGAGMETEALSRQHIVN
jgi:hypothetical protein